MRWGILTIGALLPLALASPAQANGKGKAQTVSRYDRLEAAIVAETNTLRADPAAYAKHLESRMSRYNGDELTTEDGKLMITREGVSAVLEAISALKQTEALPKLERRKALDRAAGELVTDQRGGRIGHVTRDGSAPSDRIEKHFEWDQVTLENIHYGGGTAKRIVLDLLIDDGVGNRGHREALLDSRVEVTGVACGPHARFEVVCVMEYTVPVRNLHYVGR